MTLKVGAKAPNFSLSDQQNVKHTFSNYRGQFVLLYFYPKDQTPGCTVEACVLRDNFSEFARFNTVVLGVSTDTTASHQSFAQKHDLPFTLLADSEKKVVRLYGVWGIKKFMGKEYQGTKRMSFLVDPQGKIAKVYLNVKPGEHAREVLADLQKVNGVL